MRTLDRKLLRDMARMKGQVLTIALVIAGGVAALLAALATYDSLRWSQQNFYNASHFADVFVTLKRAPQALRSRIAAIPGVAQADTRVVFDVTLDVPGVAVPAVGRMIGLPRTAGSGLNRLHLRRGVFPDPTQANEVVVSEGFATAHALGPGDGLRALINGKYQALRIVGVALSPEYVFAIRAGEPLPDDRQFGIVWIADSALAAAFDMEGAFNDVVAGLAPGASERLVTAHLDDLLAPYGGLGAYGRKEQLSHRFITDEIRQQQVMATTIPPVFLAVAAFLLHVVLTRMITTQREQIAVLKAFGYGNLPIALHYVTLAVAITLVGVALGVALGAWLGAGMTASYVQFFRLPVLHFRVQPWIPVVAGAVSLGAAVLAALNAVRRVVQLAPAEAMRPPVPVVYRRSALERAGLSRVLSPRGRMALRAIGGRPLRAAFTCLGIALSLPITIMGLFWNDAITHVIAVHFFAVERGDATVAFTEPVAGQAQRELARVPGVTLAEAYRVVPARLAAGHRHYRAAVLGLPPGAELRRVLDADRRQVAVPPEGMLVTDRLGERLGVRAGDLVTVEVLEGARPRRQVVVAGLVPEFIGMSAYMDLAALHRLMREGDAVSMASLSVDPSRAGAAYARLKQFPRVATVGLKAQALESFRETTATFVLYFTGVLTAFAVIIAVGVVYNNARIALAERAWELASLRVLGFTRAEVSAVLLTELGLQVLVAIPLGLGVGYAVVLAVVAAHETEMFRIPAVISARTYAVAAAVTMLAAVVSALVVRRRIDRLDLVSVLKTRD